MSPQLDDLCVLYRARAFEENQHQPPPVERALAFARVLAAIPFRDDGSLIPGNPDDLRSEQLPEGIDRAESERLAAVWRGHGQRDFWAGFDHSLADYPRLLAEGVGGFLRRARAAEEAQTDADKAAALAGMRIALEAFSSFIERVADAAELGGSLRAAAVCRSVIYAPAHSFHSALQLVWLTHLAFKSEGRCHMALGRMDQYLWPYYQSDLASGVLTREAAADLVCALFRRLDQIGEVQNICIGGQTPEGKDAVNELSYLILECVGRINSPHTNLSARFYDHTPDDFLRACFRLIRTGIGFPAVFNDQVLIPGLVEIGIPLEAARDACMVGCIETMLPGRQPAWSDSRFNTPLYLLEALEMTRNDGSVGYEELIGLFKEAAGRALARHVRMINDHRLLYPADQFPDPFLSALTRDCIARGLDINSGGAEFVPFHGVAVMGLATIADSLAAIKRLVFEEKALTLEELKQALAADFDGFEPLRQMLLRRAPKYGNDLDEVDSIAAEFVDWIARECLRYRLPDGGRFVAAMAANVQNISAGREVAATPDGRHAFTPLSDAASPYFGRDENGPTAFLRSVGKPDYQRVLTGSVINMRFDPAHFMDKEGEERFISFLRYFIQARIPELQFNFTSAETLWAALREPERYRDLVVRVSGFSARFVELDREVQEDIARRRAHI